MKKFNWVAPWNMDSPYDNDNEDSGTYLCSVEYQEYIDYLVAGQECEDPYEENIHLYKDTIDK